MELGRMAEYDVGYIIKMVEVKMRVYCLSQFALDDTSVIR